MREIKFRAWSKYENLMGEVTGFRFSKSQYPFLNVRFRKNGKVVDEGYHFGQKDGCDGIILMQYTGLKDKNGKEIYEGDIVTTDIKRPYLFVEFRDGCFMFNCNDGEGDYYDIMLPIMKEPQSNYKYGEVIGNIYENPELLEVVQN